MLTFDWSVVVFVRGMRGILAVRKRKKDGTWGPWHLPGGKREPFELSQIETARRELREETRVRILEDSLTELDHIPRIAMKQRKGQRKRQKHYYELYLFAADAEVTDDTELYSIDRDEEVTVISLSTYRRMKNFMGLHRRLIQKHGLVPDQKKAA
ncbi:MAG: NUDIX hydrolase [Patescibacteria group bacterium]